MVDTSPPEALRELRESISRLDRELLERFRERMDLSRDVARAKLTAAYPFRDQLREEQLMERVRATAVELELDPHQTERVFRLLVEMSISEQRSFIHSLEDVPLRISYQGVEGSNSHLTAQRHYANREGGVVLTGYETFREAADAVRKGTHDVAILPIENSTAGSINETYDLLTDGGLTIIGEVISLVAHCLLALPGVRIDELRTILSHPQALMQCEDFLRGLQHAKPQADYDTAGAAKRVRESNDRSLGAIAGESAASVYGLEILKANIQNQASNFTRFVEVALEATPCPPDVVCKTSLLLATGHHPGDLAEVLRQFSKRGVNLLKLESRPVPGKAWSYRFYLDVDGHAASVPITEALTAIEANTSELRILGTYPKAASGDGVPEDD